jgi:hypothetical protein
MRPLFLLLALALPASAQTTLGELRAAAGAAAEAPSLQLPRGRVVLPPRLAGHDDGRELAAQACQSAQFDTYKEECLRIVVAAYYFDAKAVTVCRNVGFSSDLPPCMAAIADKTYLSVEADACAREHFGSDIAACFTRAGRPMRGGGDGYTKRELRRISRLLQAGQTAQAQRELDELIDSLDD